MKQIWGFLEEQLEVAESREMTVARFVTAANEVTIGGYWREHAKGELRTRKNSSRSSRTRLPDFTPMEAEEAESSTPQSSMVSSVVVVDNKRGQRPAEASRTRYLEKVKELDLEDLECRQELADALGLKHVSHEELSRHQCVDWLKAHGTHFSRARMMETADLTGIPMRSVMGPINYRPLKLLGSPALIVEPPKHRTSIARIRLATPAQLRVVDKLLEPKEMELSDAAYESAKLADDPRYGKPCGSAQLAKTLAVYDRADPAPQVRSSWRDRISRERLPNCSGRKPWYTRCQVRG